MKNYTLLLIGLLFLESLSGQENRKFILFDKDSKITGIYFSDYKRFTPNENEFLFADSIANAYVAKYSNKFTHDNTQINDYQDYYKQVYGLIDKNENKIILLNCFCSVKDISYWKEKYVSIMGGGKCFFSIKINLNERKIFDFWINAPQ